MSYIPPVVTYTVAFKNLKLSMLDISKYINTDQVTGIVCNKLS